MQQIPPSLRRWIQPGYTEFLPAAGTDAAIECVWSSFSGHEHTVPVHPDGCVDLLLKGVDGELHLDIVGTMSRTRAVRVSAGAFFVGVRFRPGYAWNEFGAVIGELTNRVRPLQSACTTAATRWMNALMNAEHPDALAEQIALMTAHRQERADCVQRGLDALVQSHGALPLPMLSDMADLSERQFRRLCIARTGLSPKRLSGILRFRQAMTQLRDEPGTQLSELAHRLGYSDQAHMTRDIRTVSGQTPAMLRRASMA